jgi:uncharacterized protein (TIGR03546 family)
VLSAVARPFRKFIQALVAGNSSHELAAGFALGMIIGLVPKGNLIALSLFVLLFSFRCNTGLGILSVVLFSFVSTWTDPFAHQLGLTVLSLKSFQGAYAAAFNLPLGPWIGFSNTVVSGSLLVGLYLAYPVYWAVRWSCSIILSFPATEPILPGAGQLVGGAP